MSPWPRMGRAARLMAGGLLAAALLLYLPALKHGLVNLDDRPLRDLFEVLLRPGRTWAAFGRSVWADIQGPDEFYRPLAVVAHSWQAQLSQTLTGGFSPAVFRFVNFLLHGTVCGLVLVLARRLCGSDKKPWAWLAVALMALHPVSVATAVWLPGLNELLLALFSVSAVLFGLQERWVLYGLALVGALLSKESAWLLPYALLLPMRKELRQKPKAWAVATALAFAVWAALRSLAALKWTRGQADLLDQFVRVAPAGLVSNLSLVVFPWRVGVLPLLSQASWLWGALAWAGWLGLARFLRAASMGWGALLFVALVAPTWLGAAASGGEFIFRPDRFYTAMVPLWVGLAMALSRLRLGGSRARTVSLAVLAFFGLWLCGWQMRGRFEDSLHYYGSAYAESPRFPQGVLRMGDALVEADRVTEALGYYSRAFALNPMEPHLQLNWGVALLRAGRVDEAETKFREALALNPLEARGWANLGEVQFMQGRLEAGVQSVLRSLSLNPNEVPARRRLAQMYRLLGQEREAQWAERLPQGEAGR